MIKYKYKLLNLNYYILFILGLYIYLYTPEFLTNLIFYLISYKVNIKYIDQNKNLINYTFKHNNYDGELMAYSIKQELVKYTIEKNKNINIYKFKSYQYLNNNRILQFSIFSSSISYLLKEMVTYQNRKINVCIITSIRNRIKNFIRPGNFIKFACCTILPSDNILDICSKIQISIKNTQTKNYFKKNPTFQDLFSIYNFNYIFNSWKSLSSIYTKNNRILIRQSTIKISKKDIFDLKHIKQKKLYIKLDCFDNKYIISDIIKLL